MFDQLAGRENSLPIPATSAAQFPTRMYMGRVQRLLERLGYVRLRDFGLILTADRRVVPLEVPSVDPPAALPMAPPAADGEDEWEWEIAAARARASCEDIPVAPPGTDDVITAINPQIQSDAPPRTVLPVPTLPAIDPRLVRSYEAPHRFPRATAPHIVSTNRAPLPLRSARR